MSFAQVTYFYIADRNESYATTKRAIYEVHTHITFKSLSGECLDMLDAEELNSWTNAFGITSNFIDSEITNSKTRDWTAVGRHAFISIWLLLSYLELFSWNYRTQGCPYIRQVPSYIASYLSSSQTIEVQKEHVVSIQTPQKYPPSLFSIEAIPQSSLFVKHALYNCICKMSLLHLYFNTGKLPCPAKHAE